MSKEELQKDFPNKAFKGLLLRIIICGHSQTELIKSFILLRMHISSTGILSGKAEEADERKVKLSVLFHKKR